VQKKFEWKLFSILFLSVAYAEGAQILLDNNKLTQLDQSVFQPILDYFLNKNYPSDSTFISLANS
jgi:hypothetical protein